MIAISIIAVLSALAVVSFSKVLHATQSSEARQVLGQIRSGEEAYRAEMLTYLNCSSSLADWYPNTSPNDTRWAWAQPADSRWSSGSPPTGWQLLNVTPDAPVRYGYAVVALTGTTAPNVGAVGFQTPPTLTAPSSGGPWFVATAKNEHINASFKPSLALTTSYDGRVYWEGESD